MIFAFNKKINNYLLIYIKIYINILILNSVNDIIINNKINNNNNMTEPKLSSTSMLYVTFNQDASCFAVGTETGFSIFNAYPLKHNFTRDMKGGIGIIEMLNRSNILALVGGGENPKYASNKVVIWDDNEGKEISELRFMSSVKNVKLKRDKLFVICEQKIYIFAFLSFVNIENLDTYENPKGLIAISINPDKSVIAYLDKAIGSVKVRDMDNSTETTIPAHENMIACMTLNTDGTLLATCSERGTLIRIFSTKNGLKLQELRRGAETAEIYSLAFNATSKFLACSSDRRTIHVFIVNESHNENHNENEPKNSGSVIGRLTSLFGINGTYFNSEWSFAQFRIDDLKSICALGPDNTIIAISSEGKYYLGKFDIKTGGACEKVQQTNIFSEC